MSMLYPQTECSKALYTCMACKQVKPEADMLTITLCKECDATDEALRLHGERARLIPLIHTAKNFSDVVGQSEAVLACQEIVNSGIRTGKWVTLAGKSGTGKSMLAGITALNIKGANQIAWVNSAEFMMSLRDAIKTQTPEARILQPYIRADFLVLDDLGVEKGSEFAKSSLYVLLNKRWESRKPTMITTNYDAKALETELGSRILDRILRAGETIRMNNSERRVK